MLKKINKNADYSKYLFHATAIRSITNCLIASIYRDVYPTIFRTIAPYQTLHYMRNNIVIAGAMETNLQPIKFVND